MICACVGNLTEKNTEHKTVGYTSIVNMVISSQILHTPAVIQQYFNYIERGDLIVRHAVPYCLLTPCSRIELGVIFTTTLNVSI